MAFVVRRVEAGEWALAKRMRLCALRDAPGAFGSVYEDEVSRDDDFWIARTASNARGEENILFFAEEDGEAVGMVVGAVDDTERWIAHLYAMWVMPDARGKGIGKELVRVVEEWARGRGCSTVLLEVSGDNPAATRLYERMGYSFNGTCVEVSNESCQGCLQMSIKLD